MNQAPVGQTRLRPIYTTYDRYLISTRLARATVRHVLLLHERVCQPRDSLSERVLANFCNYSYVRETLPRNEQRRGNAYSLPRELFEQ